MSEFAVEPAATPTAKRSSKTFLWVFLAIQALFIVATALVAGTSATVGAGAILMISAWGLVDLVLAAVYAARRITQI